MKNNNIAAVLFVFLFLAVFSFGVYAADCSYSSIFCDANNNIAEPCLDANETFNYTYYFINCFESVGVSELSSSLPLVVYPSSPQTYPISDVWFNITIPIESIDDVWIRHNFSKSFENYTMNNSIGRDFYYILDFTPAAGTYEYRFYVNNTTGSLFATGTFDYVIENGTTDINLTLDGEENNKTYLLNQTANFSASLPFQDKTIYLESDYPGWSTLNGSNSFVSGSINLISFGTYSVTAYWNGDENYTNGSKTYYFNVANVLWSNNQTNPISDVNYTPGQSYSFQINVLGNVSQILFEADFNRTLLNYITSGINVTNWNKTIAINNDTNGNYWINFTDLAANDAGYEYRWIMVDNNSVNISTESLSYLINPIIPIVSLGLDIGTTTPSSNVVATCSASPSNNLTLYITGSGISTCSGNNSVSCSFVAPSSTGTITYNCYNMGNENYSISFDSENLVVATFEGGDTTGGGLGDGDTTVQGQFTLSPSESTIAMDAGSSKVISFSLINTYENDINITSITVSGIDSGWYALDKTLIPRLNDGTTEKVKMTLNIPANATADTYSIKVKALGKNLFSGASLTRETTVTLTVNSNNTVEEVAVAAVASEEAGLEVLSDNSNETSGWVLPTGLLSMSSEYFPYMVLVLGVALSLIVFMKRGMLTQNLMKMGGTRTKKKSKSSLNGIKKMFSIKLPKINKAEPKTLELKDEKIKDLETEIEKDIKELKNIMESEKKIKKNRK